MPADGPDVWTWSREFQRWEWRRWSVRPGRPGQVGGGWHICCPVAYASSRPIYPHATEQGAMREAESLERSRLKAEAKKAERRAAIVWTWNRHARRWEWGRWAVQAVRRGVWVPSGPIECPYSYPDKEAAQRWCEMVQEHRTRPRRRTATPAPAPAPAPAKPTGRAKPFRWLKWVDTWMN